MALQVAECGTHSALLEAGGLYAAMWNRQKSDASASACDLASMASELPPRPPALPPGSGCAVRKQESITDMVGGYGRLHRMATGASGAGWMRRAGAGLPGRDYAAGSSVSCCDCVCSHAHRGAALA